MGNLLWPTVCGLFNKSKAQQILVFLIQKNDIKIFKDKLSMKNKQLIGGDFLSICTKILRKILLIFHLKSYFFSASFSKGVKSLDSRLAVIWKHRFCFMYSFKSGQVNTSLDKSLFCLGAWTSCDNEIVKNIIS